MSTKHLAIIDYGMGNLHSVASAVTHVAPDLKVSVTSDSKVIAEADHVIFPGVGAIRDCMAEIRRLSIDRSVAAVVDSGRPLLAVCVGMQALMDRSDENNGVDCLGLFAGEVKFFADHPDFQAQTHDVKPADRLKVPHMGWNQVKQTLDHPLWARIEDNSRFYFVHSYYVNLADAALQAGRTNYGIDFTAALARGNVFAAQFHPEKSHTNGLQLLKNFLDWDGVC